MDTRKTIICGIAVTLAVAFTACEQPTDPEHVHQWGAWTVTTAAACVEEGTQTRTCALDASHVETQPIDALGHDYQNYGQTTPPTCTEPAVETGTCTRDATHKGTRAGAAALGHEWNTAHVLITAAADATTDGIEAITCKRDGSHTKEPRTLYATGTAGLAYELIKSDTEYRVRKGAVTGGAVYIPAYWRGASANYDDYLPVTEIGSAADTADIDITDPDNPVVTINGAFYNSNITALTFAPDSQLKSIGGFAFLNCADLGNIELPASLTAIGANAFSNCTGLTGIAIPASVTAVGSNAFFQCTDLASVTFAANSQLQTIGSNAFMSCAALTGITLPDSVTAIGANAFNQCTALVSVNIPAGVTVISNSVFQNCRNLAAITIPANATSIGDRAFQSCAGLAGSITIPASVTAIGESAFSGCSGLTAVTFAANSQLQAINSNAFSGCTGLTSIAIPASVTAIGNYAFNGNLGAEMALTSVTFAPDSQLATIGAGAFQYCYGIMIVTIPANVTTIGSSAFGGNRTEPMTLVTCLAIEPPILLSGAIWAAQIKVPAASVAAYKASTMWGTYADRISGIGE